MATENYARKSGMRGSERSEAGASQPDLAPGGDPGGTPDVTGIIGQHVHGPDENGHHHLNLTTLAAHIHGGKHPGK